MSDEARRVFETTTQLPAAERAALASVLLLAAACLGGCRPQTQAEPAPVTPDVAELPAPPEPVDDTRDDPCRPGERLASFEFDAHPRGGIGFSPDGALLVTLSRSASVRVWDSQVWNSRTFEPHAQLPPQQELPTLPQMIFPDERSLLMTEPGAVYVHGIDSGERSLSFELDKRLLWLQATRQYVFTTVRGQEANDELTIWDAATASPLATVPAKGWSMAISDDEQRLVVDRSRRLPVAYELPSARRLKTMYDDVEPKSVAYFAFMPGSHELVAQSHYGQLVRADTEGGPTLVGELPTSDGTGTYADLQITPDGRRIAGLMDGGLGWVWDVDAHALLTTFSFGDFPREMTSMISTPDGRLFVGGDLGTVRQWDMHTGAELAAPGGAPAPAMVTALAASPDGTQLAVGHEQGAEVWCIAAPRAGSSLP